MRDEPLRTSSREAIELSAIIGPGKQKLGSARRETRQAGSPFLDGRVTPNPANFLHTITLARLVGSTRSRIVKQSMRKCYSGIKIRSLKQQKMKKTTLLFLFSSSC